MSVVQGKTDFRLEEKKGFNIEDIIDVEPKVRGLAMQQIVRYKKRGVGISQAFLSFNWLPG